MKDAKNDFGFNKKPYSHQPWFYFFVQLQVKEIQNGVAVITWTRRGVQDIFHHVNKIK